MHVARLMRVWRQRIRSVTRRQAVDDELGRELAFHLDRLIAEKIESGLAPDEARRAARLAFGSLTLAAERSRDMRRLTWVDDLRQDLAHGWRIVRRSPGFACIAVLSFGVSIGTNAAVLTTIDRLLLNDPPILDAGRVVSVENVSTSTPGTSEGVTVNEFLAWRDSPLFDAMVALWQAPLTIGADTTGSAEQVSGQFTTAALFELIGMAPLAGRTFTADETRLVDPIPAVIITERLWRRRFGGDPAAVGSLLRINGEQRTIVGVMPAAFRFQSDWIDVWLPLRLLPETDRNAARLRVLARLAPGVTPAQATDALVRTSGRLAADHPESQDGWRPRLRPIADTLFGWMRVPLTTVQAAVAVLWLIACANVAALLLSRGLRRRRELGMRIALGAWRGRLIRQLLTEVLLLSIAGGVIGLAVAQLGLAGLSAIPPPLDSPRIGPLRLDGRAFAVTFALSLLSATAAGLVPALASSRTDPGALGRRRFGRQRRPGGQSARTVLVIGQVGLAMTVLITASLLVHSELRLSRRPLNLDPDGLFRFDIALPNTLRPLPAFRGFRYFEVGSNPAEIYGSILGRLGGLPTVTSVAGSSYPAIDALILPRFEVSLGPAGPHDPGARPAGRAVYYVVTPGLFRTMGTTIVRGREVDASDTASAPWVAVVNETAARRFWPGRDPVGAWLALDTVPEDRPRQVIGVVPDIPLRHRDTTSEPVIYTSYLQQPTRWRAPAPALFFTMTVVMRTTGDPGTVLRLARQAIAEIDPDLPLSNPGTMRQHLRIGKSRLQYQALLLLVVAATAVALAIIGVYGVLAADVGRCAHEIAIRRSLGAAGRHIIALVAGRTALIVAVGVGLGAGAATTVARLIAPQLWGIGPADPATYAIAIVCIVGVATVACVIPARRALNVDPTTTLAIE